MTLMGSFLPPSRRSLPVGMVLVATLGLAGCASTPEKPAGDAELVVQVLPFKVLGQEDDTGFVGRAFAVSLRSDLAQVEDVRLLEVPGNSGDHTGAASGEKAPREERAARFVTGTLTRGEEEIRAAVRVLRGADRSVLWSTEASSRAGDPSLLASALVPQIARALGCSLPELYDYARDVIGGPEMSASLLGKRGVDALRRSDVAELQALAPELVERFPDDPAAHLLGAWALVYAWDAAPTADVLVRLRERLTALDRVDPSSPYDELMRGFVYRSSGEPGLARTLYTQVLARSDLTAATRAWALRQRAITLLQMGNAEAARADAEKAVRLDPSSASSLFALSKALETLKEFDGAITRAKEAVALNPRAWRQHQRLGLVLSRAGRMEEAVTALDHACEIGGSREACANLAVTLIKSGRRGDALRAAKHARSLAATPFGAYNMACYWVLAGNRAKALETLRRASELGFADVLIATDSDLDSLRDDPAFEAVLKDVRESLRSRRRQSLSAFPWQG